MCGVRFRTTCRQGWIVTLTHQARSRPVAVVPAREEGGRWPDGQMSLGVAEHPDGGLQPVPAASNVRRQSHPLVRFLVTRIVGGVGTLLVASVLIFLATNALPGNVAEIVLGKYATPARINSLDRELGLDASLASRYGSWLSGIAHGDLGKSAVAVAEDSPKKSVTGAIGTALRNSLFLGGITAVLLLPLSLLWGTIAGTRAGRPVDYGLSYSSLIVGSLPEFVLGTFLVAVLFTLLKLLPPLALIPPGGKPWTRPSALVLPVLTLLGVSLAFSARQVRAGLVNVLREDYVTMARLDGL